MKRSTRLLLGIICAIAFVTCVVLVLVLTQCQF